MKFQPKAIFFDWDHTLWDHDRNSKEVIFDLLEEFQLENQLVDKERTWQTFHKINNDLWDRYQIGAISQQYLRENRFTEFFDALSIQGDAVHFSKEYLFRTPRKSHLMDGAEAIISRLATKYPLYILTNGFDDIQYIKVEGSGIGHHFQEIITSEKVGVKKPDPLFFTKSLEFANCRAEEVFMIGDHPIADVQGAEDMGIAAIHFNPHQKLSKASRQISHLLELQEIIECD